MNRLKPLTLVRGARTNIAATGKGCAMNMIAYLQGEPPNDHPRGVDLAIRNLAVALNDLADDELRQELLMPLLARMMSTQYDPPWAKANQRRRILAMAYEFGLDIHPSPRLDNAHLVSKAITALQLRYYHAWDDRIPEPVLRRVAAALDDMLPAAEITPEQQDRLQALEARAAASMETPTTRALGMLTV
jgi:hypothetical protein